MKQQVAIYLRLSMEDVDLRTNKAKDESNSISAQRQLIERHLDQNPELRDLPRLEFCDDGYSGTNFDRPQFSKMIELVKKGEISCIVVKDLSRFGRDYIEVGDYLEHIFPFLGIRVKAINDHYDSKKHSGTTIGMDIAFKNLIYDYYSKDLSKKVRSSMGMKQKQGKYVNCVLYGYKRSPSEKHQMVIDEVTAPIVRRVFMEIIAGRTATEVAKGLNEDGIPTPAAYKGNQRKTSSGSQAAAPLWTHARIHEMLKNIKYTGVMVNHTRESRFIRDKNQRRVPREEWVIREDAHEAIVTEDEFNAANDAIRRVKKTERVSRDNSDTVYYCAHCGHKLRKTYGKDTYFSCPSASYFDDSMCSKIRWSKTDIEDVVFASMKTQIELMDVEARETGTELADEGAALRQRIKQYQAGIAACEREKFNRYEDYHAGKLTAEEYLDKKSDLNKLLESQRASLEIAESNYEEFVHAEASTQEMGKTAKQLGALSEDVLRKNMYSCIERITVFDNESIEITWKFDEVCVSEKNAAGVS